MEDYQALAHIKKLTTREEELYGKENLTAADIEHLHKVQAELEQCWDYLRQRRARRDADENPDKAKIRSIDTIKNYKN